MNSGRVTSSKLILLVLTAVFELAFLGGVFFKGYNLMGTGMMFLILCAFLVCFISDWRTS